MERYYKDSILRKYASIQNSKSWNGGEVRSSVPRGGVPMYHATPRKENIAEAYYFERSTLQNRKRTLQEALETYWYWVTAVARFRTQSENLDLTLAHFQQVKPNKVSKLHLVVSPKHLFFSFDSASKLIVDVLR